MNTATIISSFKKFVFLRFTLSSCYKINHAVTEKYKQGYNEINSTVIAHYVPFVEVIIFSTPSPKLVGKSIDKFKVLLCKGACSAKDCAIW